MVISLFVNVKLLWNDLNCIKRYIKKYDLIWGACSSWPAAIISSQKKIFQKQTNNADWICEFWRHWSDCALYNESVVLLIFPTCLQASLLSFLPWKKKKTFTHSRLDTKFLRFTSSVGAVLVGVYRQVWPEQESL